MITCHNSGGKRVKIPNQPLMSYDIPIALPRIDTIKNFTASSQLLNKCRRASVSEPTADLHHAGPMTKAFNHGAERHAIKFAKSDEFTREQRFHLEVRPVWRSSSF